MQIDYSVLYHAIPAIVALILLEMILKIREGQFRFYKKSFFANIVMGLIAFALSFVVKGTAFIIYEWVYQFRFFTIPTEAWWAWVICFFADEFSYYWFHRASHHIRFFWASHAVHHSAEFFAPSVTLRLPWTANFTGTFLFWAWMPLIGINPAMVIIIKSVSVIYQFWIHTDKIDKMPKWFEAIFNTPSHHRVHHGCNVEYLDKNHGGTIILWDKLFGTYQEETVKPVFGLTKNIGSNNPVVIEFHEWKNIAEDIKRAKNISDVFHFVFGAPGWSNDGNMQTTKTIRALNARNYKQQQFVAS